MPTRDPYPTSSPNPPPPPAPLGPCAGWGQTHRVYPTIRGVYPSSSQIPDTRTPQVTPPPSSLPPPGGGGSGATSSPAPAPPPLRVPFFPPAQLCILCHTVDAYPRPVPDLAPSPRPSPSSTIPWGSPWVHGGHHPGHRLELHPNLAEGDSWPTRRKPSTLTLNPNPRPEPSTLTLNP